MRAETLDLRLRTVRRTRKKSSVLSFEYRFVSFGHAKLLSITHVTRAAAPHTRHTDTDMHDAPSSIPSRIPRHATQDLSRHTRRGVSCSLPGETFGVEQLAVEQHHEGPPP